MADLTNGRHEWPKTTPTGFTYERPTTYAELEHMIGHMVQSEIECWDEPERPPEPVWEMVGIAQQEVNRMAGRVTELEAEVEQWRGMYRVNLDYCIEYESRMKNAESTVARVEAYQEDLRCHGGFPAQARRLRAALEGEQQ